MAFVLLVTLFMGSVILNFFAIGMSSLRIAGGLLIARVGFSMVSSKAENSESEDGGKETSKDQDIAFSPIAMPLLSGPGSMAVVLSMATVSESMGELIGIGIGIVIVALISWFVLRSSTAIAERLGVAGMNALTNVMGFLLVCISIRFIITGVIEGLTDPRIMVPIVESIQKALGS